MKNVYARPLTLHLAHRVSSLIVCLCITLTSLPQPASASAGSSTELAGLRHAGARTVARPANPSSLAPQEGVIAPALQHLLDKAQADDRVRVIVRFKDQANLADVSTSSASRHSAVARAALVDALKQTASTSARSFTQFLASSGLAGQVEGLQPFWIFNGAGLRATPQAIRAIASRDDVASISVDEWRQWVSSGAVQPTGPLSRTNTLTLQASSAPATPSWGIEKIRASQVWAGLGISGTGVTVATVDTGVDWQHPALQPNYRGWSNHLAVDHLHNWYDATDEGALYPTDMNGHGTHTMGTIAGQGGIGVAPGSQWIAAKGLNGQGFGYDSWLHAAFQFMLAPGGDPSFAPDIVSNSWGNNDGGSEEFEADIAALNAAGIFVVFANGNNGPGQGTVGSPASLANAIGVGATDADDDVPYFSSRGPSPFGPAKPDLSAPGLNIVSSFPGGRYATGSGTSMATPHVAGTAALLLSAVPTLSIASTFYVLTSTSTPLAGALPSNDTGWGRIDAYSATLSVLSTGVLKGVVLDGAQPINGAQVTALSGGREMTATTGTDGGYAIIAPSGVYTLTASAYGYASSAPSAPVMVLNGQARSVNINLNYLPSGVVRGTVRDVTTGAYLTGTLVRALQTPRASYANNGAYPPYRYTLDLPAGTYTLEARMLGYRVQTVTVTIADGAIVDANFTLSPTQRIALVDTGAWYYQSAASYYQAALDALALPYDDFRVKHVPADTPSASQLLRYDTVIWSAPFDSPTMIGAQNVISALLASGRNVMLSGQDIGYYDGGGYFGTMPYYNKMNALFAADDIPSRVVVGPAGSLLAGVVLTLTGGDGANNQQLDDVVTTLNPDYGAEVGHYATDEIGYNGAGVYTQLCRNFRAAYFSFGVEAISAAAQRTEVMRRVVNAFGAPRQNAGVELLSRDQYPTGTPIGLPGQVLTHVVRLRHTGDAGITDTFSLSLQGNSWPSSLSAPLVQLGPCQTALLTLTVTIPLTATWNMSDKITIKASSANSPSLSSSVSFTSKTPAGVLLVDDDRFYNREQDYLDALAANGITADRYDTGKSTGLTTSPPLATLRQYPIVIWFNAYDWFSPLSLSQEDILRQYLDGGGRLFFTSQAALDYTLLSPFNQNYLGVADIDFNDVTSHVVGSPGNVIGDNFGGGSLLPFPYGWNLSTSVQPMSGTQVILRGDSGQPFGLARECASCSLAWRTAFMPFAFETLTTTVKADLMNRVVGWLAWLSHSSLTANRITVPPGDQITHTLKLMVDSQVAPALRSLMQSKAALTTTLSISVPLDANLTVISSTLGSPSAHNAGSWRGSARFGDVLTFTFVTAVAPGLADRSRLTATLQATLEEPGIHFSRASVVRVNAPVLSSTLSLDPARARWSSTISLTLRVKNIGAAVAPSVSISDAVPQGLSLLTRTVSLSNLGLSSPGIMTVSGNRIGWHGALNVGQSITLTYQITTPAFSGQRPYDYYNAALVDDGAGSLTQSDLWISPQIYVYRLPLVMRR